MTDLKAFLSDPLVGTVLGIVGIGLALYTYFRAKHVSRVSYGMRETEVIGTPEAAFTDQLTVLFRGSPVPRLTTTNLKLWNSGNVTIRSDDFAAGDPLTLTAGAHGEILQVVLVRQTRPVNGAWVIQSDATTAHLGFEFIDPNDGFEIRVVHTEHVNVMGIKGTVIGLPGGLSRVDETNSLKEILFFLGVILVPIAIFSAGLTWVLGVQGSNEVVVRNSHEFFVFFGSIFAFSVVMVAVIRRMPKRFGWRREPRGLE